MDTLMYPVSNLVQDPRFAGLWVDALLKSFVVLAFAGGLCLTWRRAAATTRHLIWFLAVGSLPLLPLLSYVLPSSQRPLWSVSSGTVSGNRISLSLQLAPAKREAVIDTQRDPVHPGASIPAVDRTNSKTVFAAKVSPNGVGIVFFTWVTGILLTLLYFVAGEFQLRKLTRKACRRVTDDWTQLLIEARATLRIRRRVVVLQSSENTMPLTWGWLRPKILLPAEAEQWPMERRRIVLLHELAHVKRMDCLTQMIARI